MINPPDLYPPTHKALLLLLFAAFILSIHAAENAYPPYTDTLVPVSLLRAHFPSHAHRSPARLSSLLFERVANGSLVSASPSLRHDSSTSSFRSSLDPVDLAPHVKALGPLPRYTVNGVRVSLNVAPTIRIGQGHVFAYLADQLLGAWGPGLDLRPVHPLRFPNLFVNAYNASHHVTPATRIESPPISNNTTPTSSKVTQHHLRHFWDAERELFFDVSLAFDTAFCDIYGGNGTLAAAKAHSIGVAAHEMSLTRLVSLRVGDVIGFCSLNTSSSSSLSSRTQSDPFSPPPGAGPRARLRAFRSSWLAAKEAPVDAVYLLSGSTPTSTVVGAAWVASACSRFAFGYALGTSAIIVAHEMGHTLGAEHFSNGLMQPYLRASENASERYALASRAEIDEFVHRLEGQGCLVRRHRSEGAGFTGFAQLVRATHNHIVHGTDVAVGSVWTAGEALVAMLQVKRHKVTGNVSAEIRVTMLSRSTEKGFPFSYVYRYFGAHVPHSHTLDFDAGAGIAIAQLTDSRQDDAIVVWIEHGTNLLIYRAVYAVSLGDKGVNFDHWSQFRYTDFGITGTVVALGATAGDMYGAPSNKAPGTNARARTDLVVAYVEVNNASGKAEAKFAVCRDVKGVTLYTRLGWTQPFALDYTLPTDSQDIGDVSVSLWSRPSSAGGSWESSLLFAFILRKGRAGAWDTVSCILPLPLPTLADGEDIRSRLHVDCHISKVPATHALRVAGGVALTRLLSLAAPVPTSVTFHGREFEAGGSSTWLDVEDGALTGERTETTTVPAAQVALAIGEQFIPIDTCAYCYHPASTATCQRRVRSCFASRVPGELNLVHSVRSSTIQVSPKQTSLLCAGFHAVFVAPTRSKPCMWAATRTDVLAAGARAILGGSSASVQRRRTVLGNGGFGPGYVPSTISVTVWTKKYVRWKVLNKAFEKLRKQKDFRLVFLDKRTDVRIRQDAASPHTYVITLGFRKKYQDAFLKEIADARRSA